VKRQKILGGFILLLLLLSSHSSAQETTSIEGILIQGTEGGDPLPGNLAVKLDILDADNQVTDTFTTLSGADGTFRFDNVPLEADGSYVFSTPWAGIQQSSLPFKIADYQEAVPFLVYEVTNELGGVVAEQGNLRIERYEPSLGSLAMLLEVSYVNLGDRIVTDTAEGSFTVELPVGTLGIAVEQPPGEVQRFVAVNSIDGLPIPGLRDTQPLIPGWPNILRVSFFVPYTAGAVVDMRFPFPLNDVSVFVTEGVTSLESDLLTPADQQETSSGQQYRVYNQTRPLDRGEPFVFTLSGTPATPQPAPATSRQATNENGAGSLLLVLLIGTVLIFGGIIFGLWWARQRQGSSL
jgi:hypothetical protein